MNESTVVCVLGMHRSGTSLVTRLLNLLGVYLGQDSDLIEPAADNPKGYWEHRQFVRLNQRILAKLGGSWRRIPVYPPAWEDADALADLRTRAKDLVQHEFRSAPLWGWKDPRTCLTLPFWQKVLPDIQYVLSLRNPFDVARSLERRDGFSIAEGVQLWLEHMKLAIRHTSGRPRFVVSYDDLMQDWWPELQRLAHLLGRPEEAVSPDVQRSVQAFIDKDLQHHRTTLPSEAEESGIDQPRDVVSLIRRAHTCLMAAQVSDQREVEDRIDAALVALRPEVERQKQVAHARWVKRVRLATEEIVAATPPGAAVILVDEEQWGMGGTIGGRRHIPFIERDGRYWGPPADDDAAIRELEWGRRSGASAIAFGWPAFWWLDYYSGLHQYLRSRFPCLIQNDRIVLFGLS